MAGSKVRVFAVAGTSGLKLDAVMGVESLQTQCRR